MALDFPANPVTGQQFSAAGAVWVWNGASWTADPAPVTLDAADSAPGVQQPVFKSGSATSPATPINITGAPIIPPPIISNPSGYPTFPPTGANTAPVAVPIGPLVGPAVANAAVPPSIAGIVQPQYKSGSGTVPTAASLFPAFSAASPSPPIVFANTAMIGSGKPPSTATTAAIVISTAPAIPQLPWVPPGATGLPVNTTAPVITGTPPYHPGSVVTCSTGAWTNSPTAYHYEWLRNGSPIDGAADAAAYTLVNADRGTAVTCLVTAVNAAGVGSIEAVPVNPTAAEAAPPHRPPRPTAHQAPNNKSPKKR